MPYGRPNLSVRPFAALRLPPTSCSSLRYSIDMATAGTPFYTFWSSVVNTYADRGLFERSGSHFGFYMNKCAE